MEGDDRTPSTFVHDRTPSTFVDAVDAASTLFSEASARMMFEFIGADTFLFVHELMSPSSVQYFVTTQDGRGFRVEYFTDMQGVDERISATTEAALLTEWNRQRVGAGAGAEDFIPFTTDTVALEQTMAANDLRDCLDAFQDNIRSICDSRQQIDVQERRIRQFMNRCDPDVLTRIDMRGIYHDARRALNFLAFRRGLRVAEPSIGANIRR